MTTDTIYPSCPCHLPAHTLHVYCQAHQTPLAGDLLSTLTEKLAKKLIDAHVFVTASQKDPCSNSLLEAMHCGLPAVALNDGGHPEIVGKGGELFSKAEEIPRLLEQIMNHYDNYTAAIDLPTMEATGAKYLAFLTNVYENVKGRPRTVGTIARQRIRWSLLRWKLHETLGI